MEFLNKLYSNEYFGIGLFVVMSILAFTFLVVLFFGKKDEKARIKEEKLLNEEKEEEPIKQEDLDTITLNEDAIASEPKEENDQIEIEENFNRLENEEDSKEELETFEEKKIEDIDPFVTSNLVLNTDYINEESNNQETPSVDATSDIYNLNNVMQENLDFMNEEESIEDVLSKYDQWEEQTEHEDTLDITRPVIEEVTPSNIFTEDVETNKVVNAPFSSVYLENEKNEEAEEPEKEINFNSDTKAFELPKRVDLPKRNDQDVNENIITFMNEDK